MTVDQQASSTLLQALELDLPKTDLPVEHPAPSATDVPMIEDRNNYRYTRSGPGGSHEHITVTD